MIVFAPSRVGRLEQYEYDVSADEGKDLSGRLRDLFRPLILVYSDEVEEFSKAKKVSYLNRCATLWSEKRKGRSKIFRAEGEDDHVGGRKGQCLKEEEEGEEERLVLLSLTW